MKVVVVTGASAGIGNELASYLHTKGMKVYGISRSGFILEGVTSIKGDVTNEDSINNIIKDIINIEGNIDYLVNNAGMGISGSIEGTSLDEVKKMFDVNFNGTFITSKAVLAYMRNQGYGKIINVGSVASEFAIPFQGFYSSSKAAVKVFSEALHNEVSNYGISVCTILPGDTKTSFTSNRRKNEYELEVYKKRVSKSVEAMEKDEQYGMTSLYVSKKIYKVIKSKKTPIFKTVGNSYKFLIFLKRFLPSRLVIYIVGKMYAFKKER